MAVKKKWVIQFTTLGLALLSGSCASLKDSSVDERMRFQGSFTCGSQAPRSDRKESLAEADVSRVRCAKDEWQVEDEQIFFVRTLYQLKTCENVLGRFEFRSTLVSANRKISIPVHACKIIRTNAGWIGENSGKCMINELELNHPYDLKSAYRCNNFVPEFCEKPGENLELTAKAELGTDTHRPFSQISFLGRDGSEIMSCGRYDSH